MYNISKSFDLIHRLVLRGDLYVATTRYEDVSSGTGKVSLLIKNPIGSGKKLSIYFIIDSEGAELLVGLTNDSGKVIDIGLKVEIAELVWRG